ncbi:MAG TPA: DUF262 domain-containing protein [Methylobacter sp.]|jgi:hypothetical protein
MIDRNDELTAKKYSAKVIVEGGTDKEGTKIPSLDKPFRIPIYQRLYTWEEQHVECLLDDLWEAYLHEDDAEYFIGAVVVSPSEDGEALELIDGQQRMTTLWLLASVLATNERLSTISIEAWKKFMTLGDATSPVARLDFSGRERDKIALTNFIERWQCNCGMPSCGIECNGWLKNEAMSIARQTIIRFLKGERKKDHHDATRNISDNLRAFSDYLWEKATFVITQLHANTDKNRFFDTMNSRGIQLEKHEILKARLLNGLPEPERVVYARTWDLCADIDGYIPGDKQTMLDYGRVKEKIQNYLIAEVEAYKKKIRDSANSGDATKTEEPSFPTLDDILKGELSLKKSEETEGKPTKEYKSFVSFPVFLLHVLRIFYVEKIPAADCKDISVDPKNLISEFEKFFPSEKDKPFDDKQKCKDFIHCLLQCRLLMDNYMIKGHIDEGNSKGARWEIWSRLSSTEKKEKKIKRTKRTGQEWNSITMLQSMMYFSQDLTRVPWLTNTLQILYKSGSGPANTSGYLSELKLQDLDYAEATLIHAKNKKEDHTLSGVLGAGKDSDGWGTGTPHYWFYKLEYCLWELWFNKEKTNPSVDCERPQLLNGKIDSFRFRHVTSIEHVSPQNGENKVLEHPFLDRFGNLALISVGENSTYSARSPIEKKGIFKARLGKGFIQSLKLAHIFHLIGSNIVDEDLATVEKYKNNMVEHERVMLDVLQAFHPKLVQTSAPADKENA